MIAAVILTAAIISVFLTEDVKISEKNKNKNNEGKQEELPLTSLDKIIYKLKKQSKSYVSGMKKNTDSGSDSSDSGSDDKPQDEEQDKPGTGEEDNPGGGDDKPEDDTPLSWSDKFTEADLRILSAIIYCEAADMSEDAGIAVGNVILNRLRDTKDWGHVNTIKEVIYDQKWGVQFTPILGSPSLIDKALVIYDNLADYEGKWQGRQMKKNISAAKKALSGVTVIPDSYMYFNGAIDSSKAKCEAKGKSYKVIDHHIYF